MPVATFYAVANTADGTAWTSPDGAHADDATYATAAPGKNGTFASRWTFDFASIPAGSTINSATVEIEYLVSTAASIATLGSQGYVSGAVVGSEYVDTAEPIADTPGSYALPALTRADLDGLAVRVRGSRGNINTAVTFSLDYVRVVVDYTAPLAAVTATAQARWNAASHLTAVTTSAATRWIVVDTGTVLFTEDFEAGTAGNTILTGGGAGSTTYDSGTRGTGATATYSDAQKASGSRSALLTTPSTAVENFFTDSFAARTTLYRRFYVFPTTTPGTGMSILRILTGTTIHARITCESTRQLALHSSTTIVTTMATVLPLNEWSRVELRYVARNKLEVRVYAGDTAMHSTTATETALIDLPAGGTSADNVKIGFVGSTASQSWYFDADEMNDATWPGPAVTVTAVTVTSSTRWNVAAATLTEVTTSAAARWIVAATVNPTRTARWNVKTAAAKASVARWHIRAQATKGSSARWSVATTVAKASAARWSVAAATTKNTTARWHVKAAVATTRTARWHANAAASKTSAARWNIKAAATKSTAGRWNVKAAITVTRTARYNVATAVAAITRSARWHVKAAASKTAQARWNVAVAASTATKSAAARWTVRAIATLAATATWNAATTLAATRTARWNVSVSAAVSRSARWHTVAAVTTARAGRYNVAASVTGAGGARWRVASTATTGASASWSTRTLVARTGSALYHVALPVTVAGAARYDVAVLWPSTLTPPERTYTVHAETRLSVVAGDVRSSNVAAATVTSIPAEDRLASVPREPRLIDA